MDSFNQSPNDSLGTCWLALRARVDLKMFLSRLYFILNAFRIEHHWLKMSFES